MSDTSTHEQTEQTEDESPGIRALREQNRKLEDEAKLGRQLARENAFLKAGVNTDSALGKMFATAYDGELDPEAIKVAAAEISPDLIGGAAPTPPPAPSAEPTETQERTSFANDGTVPAHTIDERGEDPRLAGHKQYHELIAAGEAPENAASAISQRLINAAAQGDRRAKWDGWSPAEIEEGRIHPR